MELRDLTLAEIRRRLVGGEERGARVTSALLSALRDDPRVGARALGAEFEQRRWRRATERRRLARLYRAERSLRAEGVHRVAGVDEVGVGPLAGPVVAAAIVLPPIERLPKGLFGLDDSKQVPALQRERLDREIRASGAEVGIGWATPEEIDALNIYQASLVAMRRAVERLERRPDRVLVDARTIPELGTSQEAIAGGDARIAAIAAASFVAKVYRDAWMRDLDARHPGYGFADNAGYATAAHRRALRRLGPSAVHRYSFAPVREAARRPRARA